jgi:hypothetical protein
MKNPEAQRPRCSNATFMAEKEEFEPSRQGLHLAPAAPWGLVLFVGEQCDEGHVSPDENVRDCRRTSPEALARSPARRLRIQKRPASRMRVVSYV